jgi:CubicO group peptidase (beta-lactamase class C family)
MLSEVPYMAEGPAMTEQQNGGVSEGFGAVATAFNQNFVEPGEDAAALAVYFRGQNVVDLWGGTDVINQRPMPADALMMVASASKGITATVLAALTDSGHLDPAKRVSEYWPEFADACKENVTVEMIAAHTAGLPFPPLRTGLEGLDLHRGAAVSAALAASAPLWEPGTAMAYHPVTYGTLLDEIVLRATGSSIAGHVQSLIARPLAIDMWIGLPEAEIPRVVPGRWGGVNPMATDDEPAVQAGTYAAKRQEFLAENPPMDPDFSDAQEVRAHYTAERPAIGAITDARALAKMYAALLGPVDGVQLVKEQTLNLVTRPRTDQVETLIESGTAGPDIRFGLGYQLASASMPGLGPASFGHTGAGGRLGIADPELDVAFGYVCNSMRDIGPGGDPRWTPLLEAVRSCL